MTPLKPLSQTLSKTLRFLNKNSSTILSIGAGVCTVGAVVSAADATSKTLTAIQEQRTQELLKIVDRTRDQGREPDIRKIVELTNNDDYKLTIKDAVRTWALPVTLTTASLACIFFNHRINAKKQAALIAATASAASMLNVYRNTVTDKLGTDADNKVVDSIITNDPAYFKYTDDFSHWDIPPDEIVTFYDENIGYFETTPYQVVIAFYNLNQKLASEEYITLTDFYFLLGVTPDHKHREYCDTYGWDTDTILDFNQSYFLNMQISRNIIGDDMVIYEFIPDFSPVLLEGTWF